MRLICQIALQGWFEIGTSSRGYAAAPYGVHAFSTNCATLLLQETKVLQLADRLDEREE
jgi:hypothetical protein